jgi:branched-subunit amino acid transport protein
VSATFETLGQGWAGDFGPYLFILLAGTLATDIWRWLGVLVGDRLRDDSEVLNWVKAVATALIAGVIGNLILFPAGALASAPVALRLAAAAIGWAAFMAARKNVLAGVVAAELALIAGWLVLPG